MQTKLAVSLWVLFLLTAQTVLGQNQVQGQKSGVYLQEVRNNIKLPANSENNVIKLLKSGKEIYAVGQNSYSVYKNGSWEATELKGNWTTAILDPKNTLWLASSEQIKSKSGEVLNVPTEVKEVYCLYWETDKVLHVGTDNGLWTNTNGDWEQFTPTTGVKVQGITGGKENDLWLATLDGIYRRRNQEWINLDEYVMAPGMLKGYIAISNGTTEEDVIFSNSFSVSQIAENGNHWTVTKENGLPYGPVTSIHYSDNELWLGTSKGAIKKTDKWDYYFSKRWLPGDQVNDIIRVSPGTIWIATSEGISEIKSIDMTLPQKSVHFNKRLNRRHIHHGFVADCRFDAPGDTASWKCYTSDNDGLWTSIYLASESFRYAVTGAEDAYENAVRTFLAMEKLETINPIEGFVSRSYVTIDESTGNHGEWHVSADGKWKWKADTSSDEIVGHMFAYPIFYKLVADGELKERCKSLVHRLMSHIVDNNFHLIDLDGKPTRWGVWSPDSLNHVPGWWYERGINSLQILSHLEGAIYITGDKKFEKAYDKLIKEHHYVENMVQQKMYFPYEINHSDDELAFLPYYSLLQHVRDPELKKTYQKSLLRSWQVEQPDRNPLWNIIASSGLDKDCDLDIAVKELQDFPMDVIKWTMDNSHRWDIRFNPMPDRFLNPQATNVIPVDERGISKWNSNPYKLVQKGNGTGEDDGAAWLLPYWMGRYHGFIIE